ncbi:MAG: DUF3822 family protein, partial [Bacteroidales bacterium]|nr:DUF3822 family protein [Bacteroidales bacterium]
KLYDAAKNREYLSVNSPLHSNETIIANVSKKLDAVNVFAFPLHIHSGLKITMPKAAYVSPSQVLTEYAFDKSSLSQDTMILYKQDGFCGFALFKGGEFLLSNDFSCSAAEDMIYFILNTLQQAGMNSGEISLIVTGGTYTEKELSLLSKFIRQVSFADLSKNVRVEAEFNEVDLQRYFMVLA